MSEQPRSEEWPQKVAILAAFKSGRQLKEGTWLELAQKCPSALEDRDFMKAVALEDPFLIIRLPKEYRSNKDFLVNWLSCGDDVRNVRQIYSRSGELAQLNDSELKEIETKIRQHSVES